MSSVGAFRAGQRVRISPRSDSEFCGCYGVIMHVGGKVCDVRIRYRPKGSKVRSTYIGTFRKEELELPRRKKVDLAAFEMGSTRRWGRVTAVVAAVIAAAAMIGIILAFR